MKKIINILSKTTRPVLYFLICSLCLLGLSRLIAELLTRPRITRLISAPSERAALVFGAGLYRSGQPTPVLQDRVATAADLYFSKKVEKLLMSGDNSQFSYNEPGAMAQYAISLGVPEEDIVLDYAGRRTYDSCYRAKAIFGLERALLVTQEFHLTRALLICRGLGIEATGIIADRRVYQSASLNYWNFREFFATFAAFWDINIWKPLPILGEKEPIFPDQT